MCLTSYWPGQLSGLVQHLSLKCGECAAFCLTTANGLQY